MRFQRQSGVFMHLTSLPGEHGIGDLGAGAREFLSFLGRADQSLWQFCPLGPTAGGRGHSPYSVSSTFAGNPLLVDLRRLCERGWLDEAELTPPEAAERSTVAYETVAPFKRDRLWSAFERFDAGDAPASFDAFREQEADWLGDYALFAALKREFDGVPWPEWPADIRDREPDALARHRESLARRVRYHEFVQWCFDEQWRSLRETAAEHGVDLVGDVPIYVALDSADVWANRELFALADGRPTAVAGVPPNPDDDGQIWGTPVYDWDRLAATGFEWWLDRLERLFDLVDVARLDHFKAFAEYWAVPADATDPADGEWRSGPGEAFFEAVRAELGELPFLAEDLGFLDAELVALRDRFSFPGMRVPQYADWCAQHHRHKPRDYPENAVAYTSTHDTDTVAGYYRGLGDDQRDCFDYAMGSDGTDVAWDVIDAVWGSSAALAFTTLPDLLGLGSEARLNTPGTATDNWRWRVQRSALTDDVADRLSALTVAVRRR